MSSTKKHKIEVTPYLYGNKLYVEVEVDGEQQEFQMDLAWVFKTTAELIDPYDRDDENEALSLIFTLEDGIREINNAVGADEGAIQYE